jgi:hypothetical protein
MKAKKPSKNNRNEREVQPVVSNIMTYIRFWSQPSGAYDKGGTFNLQLYLDYLEIIHTR